MTQQIGPHFGILEPFEGVDFADYSERLNSYFVANNIGQVADDATAAVKREADKKKVAVTISLIGKTAYSTLKDLCLPDLPAQKTYDELTEILKGYYKPKVLEVAESYRFHHTVQSDNETVTEYANKLKRLAVNCNFGTYLTRALRDQFVGGVRSQTTRKKLLSEDRTFDQALKVAQADELAERESRKLQVNADTSSAKVQPVHAVHRKPTPRQENKKQTSVKTKVDGKQCFRCGSSQHMADRCSHVKSTCSYCKKSGHLAKVCFKKKRESSCNLTHQVTATPAQEGTPTEDGEDTNNLFTVYMKSVKSSGSSTTTPPLYKLTVSIEDKMVPMEVDTGSSVTLLSSADFSKLGGQIDTLKPSTVILKSYTGNVIECLGEKDMKVQIGNQVNTLLIRVVHGPSLLGRDMMSKFTLPWQNIFSTVSTTAEDIVCQYPDLFDNSTVGKLKGIQVSLRVKEVNPVFTKPRVVPFAIRSRYEKALEKLVADDIIEKVEHSEWASPTVPIVKPSGDLRICGDYSVTINKFSVFEQYPVPTLEELLSKLSGGKRFTKIDLSQAYHQLELTPESRKYTTINTHQGLYQYKRLTYGVSSAVSIFQRTIENVLKDLPGCCVRIDDILISGESDEIHLENLHRVLQRLQKCGLKLNPDKFHFMLDEVV